MLVYSQEDANKEEMLVESTSERTMRQIMEEGD